MKKKIFIILIGILILSCSTTKKINNPKMGVNELEYFYSEDYKVPQSIEFIFTGNPRYINYYFTDLEQKIRIRFLKKNVKISFRYLDLKKLGESKSKENSNNYLFYLDINNSKIIDKKSGSDRLMKFDFEGFLTKDTISESIFKFKSIVYVIHDINNKNEKVADYLFTKLFSK